jgi:enolase
VQVIAPKIIGMDVTKQEELDNFFIQLDGTENKASTCLHSNLTLRLLQIGYVHLPFFFFFVETSH